MDPSPEPATFDKKKLLPPFILVGTLVVAFVLLPIIKNTIKRLRNNTPTATADPLPQASITNWEGIVNLTEDLLQHNQTGQFNGFSIGTDSSNRIHTSFRNRGPNTNIEEVYYKRHNGVAWEPAKKISDIASLITLGSGEQLDVDGSVVAVSPSGDVHIVWSLSVISTTKQVIRPREIYYQRSTNGGDAFSAPVLIGQGGDSFGGPTICYGTQGTQKIVNIISTTLDKQGLYAYHSVDNGMNFSMFPIATYPSTKEAPVCAIDSDGSVYVVWQDDRDGIVVGFKRRDVHFARSLDAGKTWGPVKNLTNTPGAGSSDQSLAIETSGKVHVVYHDNSNDGNDSWEMYYLQSPDRGATWGSIQKLTTTVPTSGVNIDIPSVAVTSDGKIHIVWQDGRNGYLQVFYKKGDGVTWEPEILISDNIEESFGQSIAASRIGNFVHVLWNGGFVSNGKRDVFYRKTITLTQTSLPLSGAIIVHDPMIFKFEDTFYLFSSGDNIQIRESADLLNWSAVGEVFDGSPSRPGWISEKIPGVTALWAPDVSYFGGMYHLYYSVSTDGSVRTCIGHATRAGLGAEFVDQGPVICSNVDSEDDFIAIDPNIILDEQSTPWLSFGSWLSGIKLIKLNASGARADTQIYPLASRPGEWDVIEAPFIVRNSNYYYLFVSFDKCCRGVNSTYNIRVGRSTNILGPYIDKAGASLMNGGGTLVLAGDSRWRGPGHNAILSADQKTYNVYHSYDALNNGQSTLRISELVWDADGWPISAGP